MRQAVYAFYTDRIDDPILNRDDGKPTRRFLVANDTNDALAKANQFLLDDHLNEPGKDPEVEVIGVRRVVFLDWPIDPPADQALELARERARVYAMSEATYDDELDLPALRMKVRTLANEPRAPFRNKKSGELYTFYGSAIDCTNERDGLPVVLYQKQDDPGAPMYVRDRIEFFTRFELVSVDEARA